MDGTNDPSTTAGWPAWMQVALDQAMEAGYSHGAAVRMAGTALAEHLSEQLQNVPGTGPFEFEVQPAEGGRLWFGSSWTPVMTGNRDHDWSVVVTVDPAKPGAAEIKATPTYRGYLGPPASAEVVAEIAGRLVRATWLAIMEFFVRGATTARVGNRPKRANPRRRGAQR